MKKGNLPYVSGSDSGPEPDIPRADDGANVRLSRSARFLRNRTAQSSVHVTSVTENVVGIRAKLISSGTRQTMGLLDMECVQRW